MAHEHGQGDAMTKRKSPSPAGNWRRGGIDAVGNGIVGTPRQAACPSRLGEAFRALPDDEQRRHAEAMLNRSVEVIPRQKRRWFAVLDDKAPLEFHRKGRGKLVAGFQDPERALDWIVAAYRLGLAVFYQRCADGYGGGPGHPCDVDPCLEGAR